ncbi:PHP domain-containing protein [Actinosynnema sp. NPDC047251]|uniref:PHP domain protein n=1 Tax=Saccharothrix espanaensis (strain ATCC 51144 / DSM 44229 / JCM 9112 / NBRC 15066 / NRRL 15764) TaxID=1179773 RepID=K0K6T2_SACES|nr:PHP domain-containing protein [Saccharothrix espanaensis]CCH33237.1 PHP domain protein [Saccharothrix espanaensis DSM 44229]
MSHQHNHDHDHGHGHDHHHEHVEAEGSWRDAEDDRPLSVARRRFLAGLGIAAAGSAAFADPAAAHEPERPSRPVNPWNGHDRWYAGDHHIHTQYSPGAQYEVATQVAKAREHGLDWLVITDHGGVAHQKFSVDLVAPDIEKARRRYRDTLVYQGLEWNIPGAEHATVFLPPGRSTVDILRAFEAAYDGGVLSTPVSQGGKGLIARATSSDGEPYALAALRYLEAQVLAGRTEVALMFANHPARRGLDSPHELRGWRDAAPGVAVGMEGAPGHQAAGIPAANGGRGGARGFYEGAPNADSFPGYQPSALENPYRTYGGFDWMTAKVGGLWDSLLAEGRPWWVTSTSDSHQVHRDTFVPGTQDHNTTGSRGAPVDTGKPQVYGDYWPGSYSSTLVGARSKSYVDVMRGLQGGKVVAVHGGLVDGLDLRVRSGLDGRGVTIGGRTFVERGGDVEVVVEVRLARRPNFGGVVPRLAKLDLIGGPVTGPAADRDALSAPGTEVLKTFEVARTARGTVRFTHTFRAVETSFYLRLRGGDGNRLTAAGGPVVDVIGDADPWSDLWCYANPVFIDVV